MQQEIKVSVIIPVYNVAPYLDQCLDSVSRQTLQEIEILCIDDGSTDGSLQILEAHAKKDARIRVFPRENHGAGAERNFGLRQAKGKYLSFLDSDDFFDPKMLEKAYVACEETNADFCVFQADLYDEASGKTAPCSWAFREDLLPQKSVFCYQDIPKNLFRAFNGWAWDKLYRRDFVEKEGLLFQEQRTTNDMFFVFAALVKAQRIATVPQVLAHQRRNLSDSLSVTREKSWDCFYHALVRLKQELCQMQIYEEVEQSFLNYALHFSLWHLNTITGESFEKLYNALKSQWFFEFGIPQKPKDYFYNEGEYAQYERIMQHSVATYLLDQLQKKQERLNALKKKIRLGAEENFDFRSYKIGRAITWLPRKIVHFFRYWKREGIGYAFLMIKEKMASRKRGK